jgi:cytochrome c oxidase subunit 4
MSQDTHAATPNLGWDPTDPHGINPHDDAHEGHFVADWKMQIIILAILLFFTALTVGFYNLEQWVETAFEITLPKWINIVGAMSIALVKAVLVAAFFMQLKYDKALNTFVMLFCLFCVSLFLGFSMIDLGSRHLVDAERKAPIQAGGTGYNLDAAPADQNFSVKMGPKINTSGLSIVQYARLNGNDKKHGLLYYREHNDEATFWAHFYDGHAIHRDELDENDFFTQLGFGHHAEESDANISRPRHGLTPGLFSDVEPATGSHADPQGGHAEETQDNGH